jgi:hypothetical protein
MHESQFTKWSPWHVRGQLNGIKYPGIYVIAIADSMFNPIEDFCWVNQVVYIGMTNSVGGLRGRLQQFDNTIIGKSGHGGADRVRFKHQNYQLLTEKLFVSVASFECNVKSNQPTDLLVMGNVAKFEYECFAEFVRIHGALPEFNDKKGAPKYSLTVGQSANG